MKILNAMLGKGLGGMEQALVDYSDALTLAGHEVHALIHPSAAIRPALEARKIPIHRLFNLGAWDPVAIILLSGFLRRLRPEVCIAHGNRAVSLLRAAEAKKLVAPLHNYKINFKGLSGILCPTQDLLKHAKRQLKYSDHVFLVPNMVRVPPVPPEHQWHTPPVIGAMGRFVAKKRFDLFIEALAILKSQGLEFKAVLAGGGEEEAALRALADLRGLTGTLTVAGWVEDKQDFFDNIDIFCLPSHHEPFGIVLLEAMAHALPVVSTDSEGPSEILENGFNGMIVKKGDASGLAQALASVTADVDRSRVLAKNAYDTARGRYDLPVVSAKLDLALRSLK